MRLVFCGTGPISAASLERVLETAEHEIPLVVTRPDRPRGRSRKLVPPEVKVIALGHDLPVHQPDRIREEATVSRLREVAPEAIVVVAYNQLVPPSILAIPRHGCLNVHLSLLPRYRGAAPIQHAILCGDEVTGVTVMRMAERFDTGPILRQREVAIEPDDTTGTLSPRLAAEGADLLVEVLRDLESGPIEGAPQESTVATRAPLLRKEHGVLDWTHSAAEVRNRIRAMTPWPRATTHVHRGEEAPQRVILLETETAPGVEDAPPGHVLAADADGIVVAAGDGAALRILRLQRAGSRPMDARSFLNGCPVASGDRFGPDGD